MTHEQFKAIISEMAHKGTVGIVSPETETEREIVITVQKSTVFEFVMQFQGHPTMILIHVDESKTDETDLHYILSVNE